MEKSIDVLGLGLSTIDILTPVSHLPVSNEVFEIRGISIQGGGPVATALTALGRLGASTTYLGTVARDHWGKMILDDFENYGVGTKHIHQINGAQSPVSIILVQENGNRSILYEKGLLPELDPAFVLQDLVAQTRILHLDGSHPEAAIKAAKIAKKSNTLVSLDGGAGEGIWAGMTELLPFVDILIVANQFAFRQTGFEDPIKAGPELLKHGAQLVVITDGELGCWYWDKNMHFHQPAFKVMVQDTTGAGDTFHGAFLYGFLQDWSPEETIVFASAVAALKCAHPGGRKGIPTLQQTFEFLLRNNYENFKEQ